jgi:hypothetical protein
LLLFAKRWQNQQQSTGRRRVFSRS